jgi:hypothetical protein
MVHLIRGCQSSAGLALSSNLLHSCNHVQQLLVREIFPLGMSDGTLPIRDLTFPWVNRFADAELPLQRDQVKQTATASFGSLAGTWAKPCGGK